MKTEFFPDLFNLVAETQADQDKRQAAQAARVATINTAAQTSRMNSEPTLPMKHTPTPATIANAITGKSFPVTLHMPTPSHGVMIDPKTALVTVTFPAKPERPVVLSLKKHGFRWNGKAWILTDPKNYTFDGPRFVVADGTTPAMKYALGATGCPSHAYESELARLKKELDGAQQCRGDRAMEDAQGING